MHVVMYTSVVQDNNNKFCECFIVSKSMPIVEPLVSYISHIESTLFKNAMFRVFPRRLSEQEISCYALFLSVQKCVLVKWNQPSI